MKILVVGSGGREHAIIQKLAESPKAEKIYCAPGNGGIAADAQCVPIQADDIAGVVSFAQSEGIDLVVAAPEVPLALGLVDALEAAGIKAFGPNKAAAAIEGSKVFAKDLMKKYGIPSADYQVFHDPVSAIAYVTAVNTYPVVIKADGLAAGKGVLIAENRQQAVDGINAVLADKIFGASGDQIVVEDFMTGTEVSVLAFVDGATVVPMVSAMDHKRSHDYDKGLNTGGMGAIAPNRHYTPEIAARCMDEIFLPTVRAMAQEGRPFKGCLFFGLMLTEQGPRVVEYNCRFGDPETQVVLPLLEGDLVDIMLSTIDGTLNRQSISARPDWAVCVVLASGGYPEAYETNKLITGFQKLAGMPEVTVYHAGTRLEDGMYYTAGGRVAGITAVGPDRMYAIDYAYDAVHYVNFEGKHYRRDIGIK